MAARLCSDLAEKANLRKDKEIYPFVGLCAQFVLQIAVVSLAQMHYKAGSQQGKEWIEKMYEEALGDTLDRWGDPGLHTEEKLH